MLIEYENSIVIPTLKGLKADGIDFRGTLYIGLMLTSNGAKVLEFNVRFGDPETQVILPLVQEDLVPVLIQSAKGGTLPSTVACTGCSEFVQGLPLVPQDVKDTAAVLLDSSVSGGASFWDLLTSPDAYGLPASRQSEVFLLNVFYSSITDETRGIFISENFDRSLILVDMPYLPVADTIASVESIDQLTSTFDGTEPGITQPN